MNWLRKTLEKAKYWLGKNELPKVNMAKAPAVKKYTNTRPQFSNEEIFNMWGLYGKTKKEYVKSLKLKYYKERHSNEKS